MRLLFHISLKDSSPKEALEDMQKKILPKLQVPSIANNININEYEAQIRALCSDFRAIIEVCVEKILLNNTVRRFRRSVQTMNRIHALAKIKPSDCDLIDDLMTKYSCFEHSQPEELPSQTPSLNDVKNDIQKVIDWIKEFKKRVVVN